MTDSMYDLQAKEALTEHVPEPVESVLLVLPSARRKKVFGRKQLASRLHATNYLVLTPTHLRLFGLGGRTGLKVKETLGAWPRSQVRVSMEMAERSSFFASTGQTLEWRVYCLHLTGPDLDLSVDVGAEGGLFLGDEDFMAQENAEPEVQETIDSFREEVAIAKANVDAFVLALTPA